MFRSTRTRSTSSPAAGRGGAGAGDTRLAADRAGCRAGRDGRACGARRSARRRRALARARRTLAVERPRAGRGWRAPARTHSPSPEGALSDDRKVRGGWITEFPAGAAAPARVRDARARRGARRRPRARGAGTRCAPTFPMSPSLAGNAPLPRRPRLRARLAASRSWSELLPRQGVPPAWSSWEERAAYGSWGAYAAASSPPPASPWYELRAHDEHGTIELRVPDTQSTNRGGALWARLRRSRSSAGSRSATTPASGCPCTTPPASRRTAGAQCATGPSAATLLDLDSGEAQPARQRVLALIDAVGSDR